MSTPKTNETIHRLARVKRKVRIEIKKANELWICGRVRRPKEGNMKGAGDW